ncbi:uncharacterized protein LOC122280809 [Carya illinoinensis]|nr:uncharacterized protein LOC122280809 [Carya illinoinensis]
MEIPNPAYPSCPNPSPAMLRNNDPFASITVVCHVSSSQEDRLLNCHFALESDGCSDQEDDDTTPATGVHVAPTGILMVSPPDSSDGNDDSNPHDVFQTPPEGSVLLSSEEQGFMAVDHPIDRMADEPRDAEALHDTLTVHGGCTEGTDTVDLGKDSHLGLSVVSLKQRIDDDWEANSSSGELKKLDLLTRELLFKEGLTESLSKKPKGSEQNLVSGASEPYVGAPADQNTEIFEQRGLRLECGRHQSLGISKEMAMDANGYDIKVSKESTGNGMLEFPNGESEILQSESKEDLEGDTQLDPSKSEESGEEDWVEPEEGEESGTRCSQEQNTQPIERLQYVSSSKLRGIGNSSEVRPESRKKATTLEVLKILKEGCDYEDDSLKNISIFEICQQRGVIFPQPRWSPEEGFKVVEQHEDAEGDDAEQEKREQ